MLPNFTVLTDSGSIMKKETKLLRHCVERTYPWYTNTFKFIISTIYLPFSVAKSKIIW